MPADSIRLVTGFLVRIENELHEELIDRCNKIGCRINDFIKASIEFTLHDHVEFDFGNDDCNKEEQPEQKTYYISRKNVEGQSTKPDPAAPEKAETSKTRHVLIVDQVTSLN